jgi:hypothetical protein
LDTGSDNVLENMASIGSFRQSGYAPSNAQQRSFDVLDFATDGHVRVAVRSMEYDRSVRLTVRMDSCARPVLSGRNPTHEELDGESGSMAARANSSTSRPRNSSAGIDGRSLQAC